MAQSVDPINVQSMLSLATRNPSRTGTFKKAVPPRDTRLDREVAIKLLPAEVSNSRVHITGAGTGKIREIAWAC
jgi:hypothetical protein